MINRSLVVVGSGIKFISHLTTEARAYIEQSDKVLYLVNDPAMKEWIKKNNSNSESLDPLYVQYPLRQYCYHAITNYILKTVDENHHTCVVLYGHPTVCAKPALDAVVKAKENGCMTKILPGISAQDCLFADLLINPGSCGCQSFEATDFLIHRRRFDPNSHLILWQVGIIGALDHPSSSYDNKKNAEVLCNYLIQDYNSNHIVFLYEAAQYPGLEPLIQGLPLKQLPEAAFSRISTLYVPPAKKSFYSEEMLKMLGINITDLK